MLLYVLRCRNLIKPGRYPNVLIKNPVYAAELINVLLWTSCFRYRSTVELSFSLSRLSLIFRALDNDCFCLLRLLLLTTFAIFIINK